MAPLRASSSRSAVACHEDLRTDGAVAVRNAFAAGLMLHLYEHPDSHEDLVAFENAKPKKAKKQAEPSPAPTKENAALPDAPFFSKVQKLDSWGNDLSDASRLAKCALPALRWLNLTMTKLNEDSLAQLAKAPFFSRLTHLSLDFNDDLRSLRALQTATELKWLVVRNPSELIAELQPLVAKGVHISYPPHQQVTALGEPAPDWRQLIW